MKDASRRQWSSASLHVGDEVRLSAVVAEDGGKVLTVTIGGVKASVPRGAVIGVSPRIRAGDTVSLGPLRGKALYANGEYFMVEWDEASARRSGRAEQPVHFAELKRV